MTWADCAAEDTRFVAPILEVPLFQGFEDFLLQLHRGELLRVELFLPIEDANVYKYVLRFEPFQAE